MAKKLYIQPSIEAIDQMMIQSLCVSGGGTSLGSTISASKTTDTQL